MTPETKSRAARVVAFIVAAIGSGGGTHLAFHHRKAPPPVFVDVDRVFRESSPGQAIVRDFQSASTQRHQRVEAAAQAAAAAPADQRPTRQAAAQQLAAEAQQQDADEGRSIDAEFRTRVGRVLDRAYPDRLHIPMAPLGAGVNVTGEVITLLNAENDNVARELDAQRAENERLKQQLAEQSKKK